MQTSVKNTGKDLKLDSNAVIVDLGVLMKDNFEPRTFHCMFMEDTTGKTIKNKNSWGNHDPINVKEIDKSSKAIHSYLTVRVKELTFKGNEDTGDITILRYHEKYGHQNIYINHWTGYTRLKFEFDYIVDEYGDPTDVEHAFILDEHLEQNEKDLHFIEYDSTLKNICDWTYLDYSLFTEWPQKDTFKSYDKRAF